MEADARACTGWSGQRDGRTAKRGGRLAQIPTKKTKKNIKKTI
jgi:hypothetical protein